jgi:hypothetical protein
MLNTMLKAHGLRHFIHAPEQQVSVEVPARLTLTVKGASFGSRPLMGHGTTLPSPNAASMTLLKSLSIIATTLTGRCSALHDVGPIPG